MGRDAPIEGCYQAGNTVAQISRTSIGLYIVENNDGTECPLLGCRYFSGQSRTECKVSKKCGFNPRSSVSFQHRGTTKTANRLPRDGNYTSVSSQTCSNTGRFNVNSTADLHQQPQSRDRQQARMQQTGILFVDALNSLESTGISFPRLCLARLRSRSASPIKASRR